MIIILTLNWDLYRVFPIYSAYAKTTNIIFFWASKLKLLKLVWVTPAHAKECLDKVQPAELTPLCSFEVMHYSQLRAKSEWIRCVLMIQLPFFLHCCVLPWRVGHRAVVTAAASAHTGGYLSHLKAVSRVSYTGVFTSYIFHQKMTPGVVCFTAIETLSIMANAPQFTGYCFWLWETTNLHFRPKCSRLYKHLQWNQCNEGLYGKTFDTVLSSNYRWL